jgi:hypothetical protein
MPPDAAPVGPREPCPCGSGERYKNCHGRQARANVGVPTERPFAGVSFERDLVALREVVPSAVMPVRLTAAAASTLGADPNRPVQLATVLPLARPALVRPDGSVWLGLQVQNPTTLDPSRDLVATLRTALQARPGSDVADVSEWAENDPPVADLFDPTCTPGDIAVHADFGWWIDRSIHDDDADLPAEVADSLARANEAAYPSARLAAAEAAYWCQIEDRFHLRWVRDEPEEALLDALARLVADGRAGVGDGSRLIGSFRTCGLVVPVWDLAPGTQPDEIEDAVAALDAAIAAAMADTSSLTGAAWSARSSLNSRQVTLR